MKRDRRVDFGLLEDIDQTYKFIIYKEYKHSSKADQGLILVHFSDRILNVKAEEI